MIEFDDKVVQIKYPAMLRGFLQPQYYNTTMNGLASQMITQTNQAKNWLEFHFVTFKQRQTIKIKFQEKHTKSMLISAA
jgi:hypothetical protein